MAINRIIFEFVNTYADVPGFVILMPPNRIVYAVEVEFY